MKKILYISLTGMTEPLGRSQVLEYLIELSQTNKIYLLSFEREQDLVQIADIEFLTKKNAIIWQYFNYSNKYGLFSSLLQIITASYYGLRCVKSHKIESIHARSLIPAIIGLILKKICGIGLLFDCRGFAVDEKLDSHRLKKKSFLFRILKKIDNTLYQQSSHIVTLTHRAKSILQQNLLIDEQRITVIPTCANRSIFKPLTALEKSLIKNSLGYKLTDKVIIHTGTVSAWYDFNSEVLLMKALMAIDERIFFLVLNKNEHEFIEKLINKHQLPKTRVSIKAVNFEQVYQYLNIASAAIFFIIPSYSKQASAPTKFAENVACHVPSITNSGVGDMDFYMSQYNVGYLVNTQNLKDNYQHLARNIIAYLNNIDNNTQDYEALFTRYFDKKIAVAQYQKIYDHLLR